MNSDTRPMSTDAGQAQTVDAQPEPLQHKHEWIRTGAMQAGKYRCISCGVWNHENFETPQSEPVAFYNFQTHQMRWAKPTMYAEIVAVDVPELPLYAASPRREWVSLTDNEIHDCWQQSGRDKIWTRRMITRAIEQALKERNHE